MRKTFIKILCEKLKKNKKTFLLVGDLGFNVIEDFQNKYPHNFINIGIAEQNMAGVAAGIASQGYKVFIYSIANFSTFRCAEQIRNDIDYHNFDVTIVSVGPGVAYGNQGYTHHALQDLSLMRSMPNTKIISPSNDLELQGAMDFIFKNSGPKYLRLEKSSDYNNEKKISKKLYDGKWNLIKKGKINKAIIYTGDCKKKLQSILKKNYKNYYIFSIPIWSMKSKKKQKKYINKFSEIIVIEKHFEDGGFSSWLRESNYLNKKNIIKSLSISPKVVGKVGSQDFLEKKYFKIN